ncbi:MAG: hypothetical protein ABSE98_12875 [Acidimicrobiales bacterium]
MGRPARLRRRFCQRLAGRDPSKVLFDIEEVGEGVVKLSVVANLKTLLETGSAPPLA